MIHSNDPLSLSPSLDQFDCVNYTPCPIAEGLADRALCLPLFHDLAKAEQQGIIDLITY